MKVLGIDPGSQITGYGVVTKEGNKLIAVTWGQIKTASEKSFIMRLKKINEGIEKIICEHKPDVVAVEDIFFAKNVKSALKLGHARAAALLAAARQDVHVEEYTPLAVKQSVAGYGRADKKQVQNMISCILNLKSECKSYDASDALAIAICHINHVPLKQRLLSHRVTQKGTENIQRV